MSDDNQSQKIEIDCAVCLQKCHHPTQLPCGHIFCFLCVKGVAIQSKKCAMCRANIPSDYLDNPRILEKLQSTTVSQDDPNLHQWFYEGRNGWWKYDELSNGELEASWSSGATECSLLLAGALYRIDFQTMIQMRQSNSNRRRRVCRERPNFPAKGVAGIKIMENIDNSKNSTQENRIPENTEGNETLNTDNIENINTVDNQLDVEHNEYEDVLETLRFLHLDNGADDADTNE